MDDITKKILEELVINFISEMNEWEKYCNEFDEDQLELDETEHKIKQMVASIISKYCKQRKNRRHTNGSTGHTIDRESSGRNQKHLLSRK